MSSADLVATVVVVFLLVVRQVDTLVHNALLIDDACWSRAEQANYPDLIVSFVEQVLHVSASLLTPDSQLQQEKNTEKRVYKMIFYRFPYHLTYQLMLQR